MMHKIEGRRPGETDEHFRRRMKRLLERRKAGVQAMAAKKNHRRHK